MWVWGQFGLYSEVFPPTHKKKMKEEEGENYKTFYKFVLQY